MARFLLLFYAGDPRVNMQGHKWPLEVGGQLVEVDSLLPPQGQNSELRSLDLTASTCCLIF